MAESRFIIRLTGMMDHVDGLTNEIAITLGWSDLAPSNVSVGNTAAAMAATLKLGDWVSIDPQSQRYYPAREAILFCWMQVRLLIVQ